MECPMNDIINLFDRYRPRKADKPTTAIRRLLLRRKFSMGERVTDGHGSRGIVLEVSASGCDARVLWDHLAPRDGWYDTLGLYRSY